MRSAFLGLAASTVGAWLFFVLYIGDLAIRLHGLGGARSHAIPALLIGGAGLLGAAYCGFFPNRLSRPAAVAVELLLLMLALLFLTIITASRAG